MAQGFFRHGRHPPGYGTEHGQPHAAGGDEHDSAPEQGLIPAADRIQSLAQSGRGAERQHLHDDVKRSVEADDRKQVARRSQQSAL